MTRISRRHFHQTVAAGTTLLAAPATLCAQSADRVMVIGDGTVAKYVKKDAPDLDVTLIEANPQHTTCWSTVADAMKVGAN